MLARRCPLGHPPEHHESYRLKVPLAKGVSCGPLAKGASPSSIAIYRYFFILGQPGAPIPGIIGICRVYFLSEAPRTETPRGDPAAEVGVFWKKVDFTDSGNAWTTALGCRCVPRWIVPGRLGSALGCSGTRLTAEATGTESALGIRFLLKDSNWGALWAFRGVAALASLPVLVGFEML